MADVMTYYVCQTLLGGQPDINRRTIYRGDHSEVCTFNQEMKPWTEHHQRELKACISALWAMKNPDDPVP